MRYIIIFVLPVLCFSCHSNPAPQKISVNQHLLDSVIAKSDTSYTKRYRNTEFATAEYHINRKDSTVCQLMKDSSGQIRQMIIATPKRRLYFAEYFSNGQLAGQLPLDEKGLFNGPSKYYYENGAVKMEGNYAHGFFSGIWKNYDRDGHFISEDHYDENGQLIESDKK